jgi:hypothetical protein
MRKFMKIAFILGLYGLLIVISGCNKENPVENPIPSYPEVKRQDKLPGDISKRGPATDQHPPILHSSDFTEPVPLSSGVNTSGAEDSPFILPNGSIMYFFFTPDVRIPAEQQLLDEVTGVWVSHKVNNEWQEAERVWLQDPGKLALDGAVAVQANEIWFASAREGFSGVNMFTAEWIDNRWASWQYSGNRLMKEIQIGEVHLYHDSLYFHSNRTGGRGSFDIWVTCRNGGLWSDPINIESVNSAETDGWPFISTDGNQLWFTRTHQGTPAIFRSLRMGGSWSSPELIVSQFAGEPTSDDAGNIYFVHHFYENGVMIEADIYVAYKK